jgi:hypothetical protein
MNQVKKGTLGNQSIEVDFYSRYMAFYPAPDVVAIETPYAHA